MSELIHGGDIVSAAARYGIAEGEWIDLSTGINPYSYPVPVMDGRYFQQLPYQNADFKKTVTHYYGSDQFIACNGTQQVIDILPRLLPALPVLLPEIGYQEHQKSWAIVEGASRDVNSIYFYPATDQRLAIKRIELELEKGVPFHLVVINPNNPTGLMFSVEQIFDWAARLPKGGFLIIDEAFIDLYPEQSVLSDYDGFKRLSNLLVLRSFGKFFGLAGLRLGFLFGPEALLRSLSDHIGPWSVNGPAQAVATAALNDQQWQQRTRERIQINQEVTLSLFSPLLARIATLPGTASPVRDPSSSGCDGLAGLMQASCGLFNSCWIHVEQAKAMYDFFAQRGVLLRIIEMDECFTENRKGFCLLRIGIIDKESRSVIERLQQVINAFILTLD